MLREHNRTQHLELANNVVSFLDVVRSYVAMGRKALGEVNSTLLDLKCLTSLEVRSDPLL